MRVILSVLRDRYESVEEALRIVNGNFMADLKLDDTEEYEANGEYSSEAELAEKSTPAETSSAQNPPTKLKF